MSNYHDHWHNGVPCTDKRCPLDLEKKDQAVTRPEPVKETRDLIVDWDRAAQHVRSLEEQLERAREDLKVTAQRLGKHMVPSDAKYEEVFQIWFGDGLLKVWCGDGEFVVSWRTRPRKGI